MKVKDILKALENMDAFVLVQIDQNNSVWVKIESKELQAVFCATPDDTYIQAAYVFANAVWIGAA